MTADQVKAARAKLAYSQAELAIALDLRGASAWQTVSAWENGARDVPGPVAQLLAIWTDKRCPTWAKPMQGEVGAVTREYLRRHKAGA